MPSIVNEADGTNGNTRAMCEKVGAKIVHNKILTVHNQYRDRRICGPFHAR